MFLPQNNYYVDLTVTAANVAVYTGTPIVGVAGEAITRGQALYKDLTDASKLKLADADVQATARFCGIALADVATGQYLPYLPAGAFNPGAAVVVGTAYVCSTTPGGIAPLADLTTGDFFSIIGFATTTSRISMVNFVSETALS